MSTMSSLNIRISISIRKKLMLMLRLSSLAHKLLMLMFMLVSLVRTGLYLETSSPQHPKTTRHSYTNVAKDWEATM